MAAVAPEPSSSGDFAARIQAVQARLAASVARAGLKDDAYAHVIEAQSAVLGELVAFVHEVRQVRQPPAVFTDAQVNDIGHRLLGACQMWSRNLMRASLAKSWAVMAAVVLGAMLVGGVVSWLAFGQPLDTQCRDERGGRWCVYWLTQPTAAQR